GVATLIFFVVTGGRVPSYLGSSFAFIGPVLVATGAAAAAGPNPQIGLALGGIIAAGAVYAVIGLIVILAGHGWVEKLMPPVVTGGIVAAIGLVRHGADRAGRDRARGREPRAHQGDRRDDGAQSRLMARPRLSRRRHRHHGLGLRRGYRRHHLCREHGRDGDHAHLFDRAVRCGRLDCDPARLLAEVRRPDPDHSGSGARRAVDRGVRPDRRYRRPHLGREWGRLLEGAQP